MGSRRLSHAGQETSLPDIGLAPMTTCALSYEGLVPWHYYSSNELLAPNTKPKDLAARLNFPSWERLPCTSIFLTLCIIVDGWSSRNTVLCKCNPCLAEAQP